MNLLLLVLLIVGALVLAIASRQLRNGSATRYSLRPSLLTRGELAFLETLVAAKPAGTYLAPKVRLADVFDAPRGDRAAFARISQKHVDFLLIDEGTCRPLLGIELDDRTHERTDRRERDALVDRIFASAGLPLLHVKAKAGYNFATLTAEIRDQLQTTAAS